MATVELKVKAREKVGTGGARKIRREGSFPAVLYGEGEGVQTLSVDSKAFYPVIHTAAGENVVLNLRIEGHNGGECLAIIKDIQYHPVRRDILHVDFQHISMTKEIVVRVPVEIRGEAFGVKTRGGILEVIHREIEVECLPGDIPDGIALDVTELDVGDSLQVKDLRVEKATIISDPDETVVTIVAPSVIEEAKPAAAEEVEEGEEEKPAEGAGEAEVEKKPGDAGGEAEK